MDVIRDSVRPQTSSALPSESATGGVYKGQGRSRREILTHDYKAFRVRDQELQWSGPQHSAMKGSLFTPFRGQGLFIRYIV